MKYTYIPKGVCSTKLDFELDGDILKNVHFTGGCNGNLKAISALVEGMPVDEVTEKLSGISCGLKSTSCTEIKGKKAAQAFIPFSAACIC